jgi:hypothetical protein
MKTIYDWLTLGIFAGLIVLFLQRSTSDRADKDVSLFYYLGGGVGCALANYFGNRGEDIVAIPLLVATVGFIIYFLKPYRPKQKP